MGLAILGVIVLLYIVLAYFTARSWPTGQAVLVVFLFIATLTFCILTAALLRVQAKWRGQYETLVTQIEQETERNELLRHGSDVEDRLGVSQLQHASRRLLIDRGRVWRRIRLVDAKEGQLVFNTSRWTSSGCRPAAAEDDADTAGADQANEGQNGDDAAGAANTGLAPNAIVFAFKEQPLSEMPIASKWIDEGEAEPFCRVPYFYMGEYKVVADPDNTPNSLVLEPTLPLTDAQKGQLNEQHTWAFYEVMPIDSPSAFENLDAEQVAQLIPRGSMSPEAHNELVNAYVRDLGPAEENDPPERKWLRVRFLEPHSETVDVDIPEEGGPLADSVFDASGRSLVAILNQGSTTEFQKGDEQTFDFATARQLIDEGKAELVAPIYHRPKRDYARYFRSHQSTMDSLQRQVTAAEEDLNRLTGALEKLKDQQAFQESQRANLQFDVDGLAKEREILNEYLGRLDTAWNELRAELSRLYRTNRSLVNSG